MIAVSPDPASPGPELSLVVPTFNEAENLRVLLPRLEDTLKGLEYEVIVVDDDSPDGSWRVARDHGEKDARVRFVRRENARGLGTAVLEGFRQARGRVLAVMDADLQHDETILPRIVEESRRNELVVATRFAKGGGTGRWSWLRKLQSRVASELAHLVLDVRLSDPMSGFFALRREVYERVADRMRGQGFKVLVELDCLARPQTVAEVPYVFRLRKSGRSKLTRGVIADYLSMLVRLRLASPVPGRLMRFVTVGLGGAVVNMACLWLLAERLGVPLALASALAVQIAIVHNFLWNDLWTFRHRRRSGSRLARFARFELAVLFGLAVNVGTVVLLHRELALNLFLANAVGIAAGTASNFTFSKLWAWREPSPTSRSPRALSEPS